MSLPCVSCVVIGYLLNGLYFLPSCRSPFHCWSVLCCREVFNWCCPGSLVFFARLCSWRHAEEILSQSSGMQLSPVISSKFFAALVQFRSVVHFELIFVLGARWGSTLLLLHWVLSPPTAGQNLCFSAVSGLGSPVRHHLCVPGFISRCSAHSVLRNVYFMLLSHRFDAAVLQKVFESGIMKRPLCFPETVLAIGKTYWLHTHFRMAGLIFSKKTFGIWLRIALNLDRFGWYPHFNNIKSPNPWVWGTFLFIGVFFVKLIRKEETFTSLAEFIPYSYY